MTKSQRAAIIEIIDAINSDEYTRARLLAAELPKHLLDYQIWSAGENMPGYLPDSPYQLFFTNRAARGHCRQLERSYGGSDYVADYMPTTLREQLQS